MKKLFPVLLFLLLFCNIASAAPHKPRIADWKFWVSTGVKVGLSGLATYTINKCRQDHGIGPCWGGDYGPFPAKEAIRNSVSIGTIPLTYLLKRQEDEAPREHKVWYLFDLAQDVWNGGTIIRNYNHQFGPREVEAQRAARNYALK